jgi:hypothetical protein
MECPFEDCPKNINYLCTNESDPRYLLTYRGALNILERCSNPEVYITGLSILIGEAISHYKIVSSIDESIPQLTIDAMIYEFMLNSNYRLKDSDLWLEIFR